MAQIERARKEGSVDLSTAEDLSLAVMNLISLEEHFFFTAMKTGRDEYLDTSAEIRNMRKELLAELMPNHEGETWCASKHLLSSTMRLIEVANKLQSANKKKEALELFKKAYQVYAIFWALKLKLINSENIKTAATSSDRLEDLVTKLADCCQE
ncbi:MAG: hypothetical protein COX02_01435 [Candidatus Vogelbacteria bacterium CG22_combo_CG10-13_8_21_14_all_37_9]|uniref:Uncharacterized protein n=1 Tax=Candidatus Vogelbacteria bacterium CG22_combo_CG10-13_8_21_14_all_37_9 TaxID=1975046 RepID=A0A2H0BKK7_9BACT|nr:MAG: hypothetical protein COX02_01435 [Candidatus Vogelbacteria bacterium CG22_combo_CG10-13_8_21_14_all_37_9]